MVRVQPRSKITSEPLTRTMALNPSETSGTLCTLMSCFLRETGFPVETGPPARPYSAVETALESDMKDSSSVSTVITSRGHSCPS